MPKTIAVIPDGNRRWARFHRLSFLKGYDIGVRRFMEFTDWCKNYGINSVSVWALSTENLQRERKEVSTLFKIYKHFANDRETLKSFNETRTRFNIIGNIKLIPKDLRVSLQKLESKTREHTERAINMLIGYGGKDDILHAVRSIIKTASSYKSVNESLFRNNLISSAMPDIDFIIRTSGEQRLSGFMPWQTGYSELYFSDKLWPEFTKRDLHTALLDYVKRQRRFGR